MMKPGISIIDRATVLRDASDSTALVVKGSRNVPWQSKSLPNLKKLYPGLTLDLG